MGLGKAAKQERNRRAKRELKARQNMISLVERLPDDGEKHQLILDDGHVVQSGIKLTKDHWNRLLR